MALEASHFHVARARPNKVPIIRESESSSLHVLLLVLSKFLFLSNINTRLAKDAWNSFHCTLAHSTRLPVLTYSATAFGEEYLGTRPNPITLAHWPKDHHHFNSHLTRVKDTSSPLSRVPYCGTDCTQSQRHSAAT